MPNVKGKQYPYTPSGMLAAKRAQRQSGQPMAQPNVRRPMVRPMARPMVRPMVKPMVKPMGRPMARPMNRPIPGQMGPKPLRKTGSGGSRRMGTPSPSKIMGGKKNY